MRTFVAVATAPLVAVLRVLSDLRGSATVRIGLALIVGAVAGLGVFAISGPTATIATNPSEPVPVTSAAVRTDLQVGQSPNAAIDIAFSTPMSEASVAAALTIAPGAAFDLRWDAGHTLLTVTPRETWQAGTYHTITVAPGALAMSGQPMVAAVRAAFLTRAETAATIVPTVRLGTGVGLDTGFELTFDHPVDAATLSGALTIDPPVAGTLERIGRRTNVRFVFVPATRLAPNARYTVSLSGNVRDADGAAVGAATLTAKTGKAPAVVRFRPLDKTAAVAPDATISVRFTDPMDRASTKAAFTVTAGGKRLAGKVSFVENDTVLVFDPLAALGDGQRVVATVSDAARSATGLRLAASATATFTTFTTVAAGKPARAPRTSTPVPAPPPPAAGSGGWAAVEAYYLTLMNCTRTGGLVTSGGACSSPGGRLVAPLVMDAGISARVSRPYAKLLATRGACNHFIGGNPGDRLRRAGFASYVWAENLGCRSGNPSAAVLGSHLFFQAEKSYLGGHYVNLMNAKYDRVGIGVWVSGGRVRLVVDFYHPR